MSYERDKEIFTRNKRVNIINKLDSYVSRTNCTSEEMDTIMDAANNMEIEKLEELEKYLDSARKGALYDGSYIIKQIYDLMGLENIESNNEEVEETITTQTTVMDKLADYLLKSNCTSEEIDEIFKLSDQIIDNNIDDLDKVEQFIDNAEKNEIYNVKFLKNIMTEIISQYSNETDIVKNNEEIIEDELEDEDIKEEVKRDKKGIITWFKEKFSKKDKKIDTIATESSNLNNPDVEVQTMSQLLLQVYVDEYSNNFIKNTSAKELGFISKEDLEKSKDGLYLLSDEELEKLENTPEIEIEYIYFDKTKKLVEVFVDEDKNDYILTTAAKELNIKVRTEDKMQLLTEEELDAIKKMDDIDIKYVDIKTKNGGKKDMKSNKVVTFFKNKFSKKEKEVELDATELELEDEEIEEVKRDKKGIKVWFKEKFSKKDKKEKKTSKIVDFFKNKFSKKDIELEDEEIEEITERQKFRLFKKKDKEVRKVKDATKYEDLSIQDKLFKYLHGTKYTWKDLINIVNKVAIINEDEEKAAKLNEFLDKNKDLDSKKKVAALVYEIVDILGNKESSVKINPMCEQIKEFFAKNKLDENEEVINLYNEIIMNDNNIDQLYDYVLNNMEEAKNAKNIVNEMNKILGKEVEKNDTIKLPEIKDTKDKKVSKTVVSAEEKTVELPKTNTTKIEKENKVEISYDKYKKVQDELNDKLNELEYLKHEYSVLEKSIYGKSLDKLSVEKKRDIMLTADSQKLIQLKEKLSEIKEVQQQIDKLSLRAGAYYMKYGVDVKSAYEEKYSQDYNEAVSQREREDKMDESLYLFNKFKDDEIAAIYKYMDYEKTLK